MEKFEFNYCPMCSEKLGRKNIEGKPRKFCPKCGYIQYINPTPVVAILIEEDGKILFVKRKYEPAKHKWALPGGFVDDVEHPEIAAKRELKEETSLKADNFKFIGLYAYMSEINGPILMIGYNADRYSGKPKPGDDAEDVSFYSIDDLPDIPFVSHQFIIKEYLARHQMKKTVMG